MCSLKLKYLYILLQVSSVTLKYCFNKSVAMKMKIKSIDTDGFELQKNKKSRAVFLCFDIFFII